MLNPTQPQQAAAPQQAKPNVQMAPQAAQPQAQSAPMAGQAPNAQQQPQQQSSQAGSSSQGGQTGPNVDGAIEQYLNNLPAPQQAYLNHFLTPEIVTVLGIVAGPEVYNYLKKFTDPSKMAVVVPRNQGANADGSQQPENAANQSALASSGNPAPAPGEGSPSQAAQTQS